MKFKITYSEGDTIDKTEIVEANCKANAMLAFWLDHAEANDVAKVELVTDD